jgi:hypothetical protein
MNDEERIRLENIAGVVEDAAAVLRGEVDSTEDNNKWLAGYLMQAATIIRKMTFK